MVIAAITGLIRRVIKRQWPTLDWPGLLVALTWLGVLIATAVRYSFNIYDIHGRLLYPALAPIGVVLALGLSGWPKPKWVMGIALAISHGDRGARALRDHSTGLRPPDRFCAARRGVTRRRRNLATWSCWAIR